MNDVKLPLLNLFQGLRKSGFPLGIEDYMLALQALQAGFGIGDRSSLEQLCCTLWTKSPEEADLLRQLLGRELKRSDTDDNNPPPTQSTQTAQTSSDLSQTQTLPTNTEKPNASSTSPEHRQVSPSLPVESSSTKPEKSLSQLKGLIQASQHSNKSSRLKMTKPAQSLTDKYLPVTSREICQSWRLLRHLVREDKLQEWDILAMVEKIAREGIIVEPVLMQRYRNRVKVILLVDQGGSMVPFHHLSRELTEKAQQGGNITQINAYYFHNYPEKYLYLDPTRLEAQSTTEVLASLDKTAVALLISDAGAARGNYNQQRVIAFPEKLSDKQISLALDFIKNTSVFKIAPHQTWNRYKYTKNFLEHLKKSIRYYAWLNPMPKDSWQYTTASDIAKLVPMFEMSRQGLHAAIDTLGGRHVY